MADLQRLMAHLRSRLHFLEHDQGDYSLDLDPLHTDWATMGRLRELGFNHIYIGVSDASSDVIPSVAGYQDPAPIQSLIDAARTLGFSSVNVDLGYGHAWQTCNSFAAKLASLIALEPDRLQVFDYAQAPGATSSNGRGRCRRMPTSARCARSPSSTWKLPVITTLAWASSYALTMTWRWPRNTDA